ncbi:hypothetical protein DV735_g5537, partial [Chaetothyriales sp. CBS 134920]
MFSATRLQVGTYLLGVCPFSIAFLVFLNSSVSFVVTDLIGRDHGVGDAVGSLGFADELLALVACPLWGLISDRIGVRYVCVAGYLIIGLSLVLFVQARNVYPQLLLGRLLFSLGGAAATTMVTAVLPAVSSSGSLSASRAGSPAPATQSHTHSPSVTSELTITPDRFRSSHSQPRDESISSPESISARDSYASTSRIAGLVGMFTGCGALIALAVFLPLPANFQNHGVSPGVALQYSFYIVAAVAFILAIWCFWGLRRLSYEANLHRDRSKHPDWLDQLSVTGVNLRRALHAGFQRSDICLGYLGGAVARASSVGISLFIPLLVNALFSSSHLCQPESAFDAPAGLPGLKRQCPRAYIVAAQMTGICETVALISAPVFGYLSSKTSRKGLPMMVASACGLIGYTLLPTQFSPDDKDKGRRAVVFLAVSLIGVSQIGAIVCSLGVLSHGVLAQGQPELPPDTFDASLDETEALLEPIDDPKTSSSSLLQLKGAVAGIYSFYGGAAILVLTKLGGSLFDSVSFGAPFYMMAALNGILFVAYHSNDCINLEYNNGCINLEYNNGWINLEYNNGWIKPGLQIQTLHNAGLSYSAIQAQLSVTIGTIRYALKHQLSPQHKRAGRMPHLNQRDGDLLEAYKQLAAEVFPDRPSIGVAAIRNFRSFASSLDTLVGGEPHHGFGSEEEYLKALREWIESKTYYESDAQLHGWYGTKTKQDYLSEPSIFGERRARKRAEKLEKARRDRQAAVAEV